MSELLQIEFIDDNFTVDKSEDYQLLVRQGNHRSQMAIFSQQNRLLLLLSWQKDVREERVDQLLHLAYQSKVLSIDTNYKMLIPNELYNPSQEVYYLNAFFLDKENHSLLSSYIKPFAAQCIYGISKEEQRQLLLNFPDFMIQSGSTAILSALAAIASDHKNYLSINFGEGYADFSYISDGKLIYHHMQPSQDADEFNYFLLAIAQEYNINLSSISIIISGQIEVDDPTYQRLKKYSNQLSFLDLSGVMECSNFNVLKKGYQKLSLFGLLCA
ncbi:DUF3822 family protein [Olivibacter sp. SA151]|uniref:DUF3822 family protein n=1 Tax=Olivibacter jilunii TaxID=985016 RepID=UPI003F160405